MNYVVVENDYDQREVFGIFTKDEAVAFLYEKRKSAEESLVLWEKCKFLESPEGGLGPHPREHPEYIEFYETHKDKLWRHRWKESYHVHTISKDGVSWMCLCEQFEIKHLED